jgi:SH3-like domain-containing protein
MNHNIEWTTTNRGAPTIIFQQQKYRQRCVNKDGTQLWMFCNKFCGVSMLLNEKTIVCYPVKHNHVEIERTPEVRKLIQQIYQQTKDDLLRPITLIYQQNLKEYVIYDLYLLLLLV